MAIELWQTAIEMGSIVVQVF